MNKKKVQVWVLFWPLQGKPQVLLLQTSLARGSFWQPVTGSVEKDEDSPQAALREAREETGLNFKDIPSAIKNSTFTFENRGLQFEESGFYFVILDSSKPPDIKLDKREHAYYEWLSPKEALKKVKFESNRKILTELLQQLDLKTE